MLCDYSRRFDCSYVGNNYEGNGRLCSSERVDVNSNSIRKARDHARRRGENGVFQPGPGARVKDFSGTEFRNPNDVRSVLTAISQTHILFGEEIRRGRTTTLLLIP